MSILETFYILFKSDSSDLKKGTDEALNSTKKLSSSLSSIDKASEKVGKKFLDLARYFGGAIAAYASARAIISGLSDAVNYDIDLGKTSRALGVNIEKLDLWRNALVHSGGSAEEFDSSLRSLAEHFHTTASVAIQALPQLANLLRNVSLYSALNYGKANGISESLIILLRNRSDELKKILEKQKELGVVTEKEQKITTEYSQSITDLDHAFRSLYNSIAIPVLPSLTNFVNGFIKGIQYLTRHKDLIVGALTVIGSGIAIVAIELVIAGGSISFLIGLFLLLASTVGIIFDDINTHLKGGRSIIDEYIDEWKRLGYIVSHILDDWDDKFLNFLSKFKIFKSIVESIRDPSKNSLYSQNEYNKKGVDLLAFASSTPLNTQTSNSILNSSAFNRNANINTGAITIITQANDAEGIAINFGKYLNDHLKSTGSFFSDNVYG